MMPFTNRVGSLILPDSISGNRRPDVGVVIAEKGTELSVGDSVLVRPYDGTWYEDFQLGGVNTKNQVRFYGIYQKKFGPLKNPPYWDSILAIMKNEEIRPTGQNILIKREAAQTEYESLILPESMVVRSCVATIVSVGNDVTEVAPGDRIIYESSAILDFDFTEGDQDLALIPQGGIYSIIA